MSKYANLPGIDFDSPDSYETPDEPESHQQEPEQPERFADTNIVSTSIDQRNARAAFRDKHIVGDADFSQRVRGRGNAGYSTLTEYEMHCFGDPAETLSQKLERLSLEVEQCEEAMAEQQKENAAATTENAEQRQSDVAQLNSLKHRVSQLHAASVLGDPSGASVTSASLHPELMAQLDAATSSSPSKSAGASAPSTKTADVQLYQHIVSAGGVSSSGLGQRIAALEKRVGSDKEVSKLLASYKSEDATGTSLTDAMKALQSRVKTLDWRYLEQAEARMSALNAQLVALSDKKVLLDDKAQQAKVTEAYELMSKWDGVVDSVPGLLNRLEELAILHERALQFDRSLAQLDTSQHKIQAKLTSDSALLKQVNESMDSNFKILKERMDSLGKRVEVLK